MTSDLLRTSMPRRVREIVARNAERRQVEARFYSHVPVAVPQSKWVSHHRVDDADGAILDECAPEDFVISRDVPLAARVDERAVHIGDRPPESQALHAVDKIVREPTECRRTLRRRALGFAHERSPSQWLVASLRRSGVSTLASREHPRNNSGVARLPRARSARPRTAFGRMRGGQLNRSPSGGSQVASGTVPDAAFCSSHSALGA